MNLHTTMVSPAPTAVASWASDFMVMSPKQQNGAVTPSQIQSPMQVASPKAQNTPSIQMQGMGMCGMQMVQPNFAMQGVSTIFPIGRKRRISNAPDVGRIRVSLSYAPVWPRIWATRTKTSSDATRP